MGLTTRRSRTLRARSRAGVAIVVLAAWFGSLLVAAPFTSPASAAPAEPGAWDFQISGPVGPGANDLPTWTFTLPADSTTGPDPASPPAGSDPSDTATSTVAITHRGECYVGTGAPSTGDFVSCTDPAGPSQFTFTPPKLTADGSYSFYVRDVETTTTTTTVYHADGSTTPVVDGPTSSTGSAPAVSSSTYDFDAAGPSLSFDPGGEPPSAGTDPTPTWAWTVAGATSVDCTLSDGTTPVTTSNCTSPFTPTLTADGPYTFIVTATDSFSRTTVLNSSYTLQTAGVPGVSVAATGSGTTPTWTMTPPAGTTPTDYSVVLSGPSVPAAPPVVVPADPTTHGATYTPTLSPANEGYWKLVVTATVDGRPSASANASYLLDTSNPDVTITTGSAGTSNANPAWTVAVVDADPSPALTCAVTPTPINDPGSSCGAYATWAAPSEGTWTLTATATDGAGNVGTASSAYTYDIAPAAPSIVTPPTGNGATATWTVTTQSTATLTCTVTGPGGFSATAPTDFSCPAGTSRAVTVTLPPGSDPGIDGNYVLSVTATDAGGANSTTATPYVLDRTPPPTPTFDPAGSSGSQNTAAVSWPFTATGGTVQCELVQGPAPGSAGAPQNNCTSPYAVNLASPGEWWVRVTVTDAAGNVGTADSAHVFYDTTPPTQPTLTRNSSSPTRNPATSWTIGTAETSGFTLLCSWSGPAGYTSAETACPASYAFTLPATNGTYTLSVVVRDAAGNRSTATTGTVLFDDIAPVVTFTNPPTTPRNITSVTWTTTVTETGSGSVKTECQLVKRTSGPDTILQAWTTVSCGRSVTRTLSAGDGFYYLQVRDTDAAGNVVANGTASADVELDTAAPGIPSISGTPTQTQNTSTASWTITPAAGTTRVDCDVFHNGVLALAVPSCDVSGVSLTFGGITDEGDWQIKATAFDEVDNASAVVPGPVVTYDITAPSAPVIVAVPTPSNNPSQTWTINTDVGTSLECAWTTGGATPSSWFACATPAVISVPAPANDGVYTLHARATDIAGNTGGEGSRSYQLDRTLPAAPTFSTPTSPSSSAAVSWTVGTGTEVSPTIQCRLLVDDGTGTFTTVAGHDWAACTSPFALTLPVEGGYRAQARVTDQAGNLGPVGTSATYIYDKTPPAVPSVTGPTGPSQTRSVTWTITPAATDGGTSLQCRYVDNGVEIGSFSTCGTSVTRTALADGTYALEVQSVDDAGNLSTPVVTGPTYVVDNAGPAAPTFGGTAGTSNVKSTAWSFNGELGATARCLLYHDGVALAATASACSTGDTFALNDGDGSYRLEVYFVDVAGNDGTAALSPTYLLDTVKPALPVVHGPTGAASTKAVQYVFTGEAASVAECRLLFVAAGSLGSPAPVAPGAWSPCTSPWSQTLALGDGRYQAEVHVTDAAGNVSPDAQSEVYELDTTGPLSPSFTAQPTGTDNVAAVQWDWTGETPTTGTCTLSRTPVGGTTAAIVVGPVACDSETFSTTLTFGDGFYQLSVQLTDPQGNAGAVAVSTGYNLDLTPPGTPTVTGPSGTSNVTTAGYAISSTVEAGATAECKLTRDGTVVVSDWASCNLPRTINLVGDGSYVLQVRLTDQYGNLGPAGASPAYLLDTIKPAAPDLHGPTGVANVTAAQYVFTAEANSVAECRLLYVAGSAGVPQSSGAFTPCASPWNQTLGLGDGRYQAEVRVTDQAGNVSPSALSEIYELDTTGPLAPSFTAQPTGTANVKGVTWTWTGETPTTGVCRLFFTPSGGTTATQVAGPVACDAQTYATTLAAGDGFYQLTVRLTDPSGNPGALATSTGYTLDATPPGAPVVNGPTGTSNKTAADYVIVGPIEALATEECKLTRDTTVVVSDWAPCTLPRTITLSGDGSYVLQVRLTDRYGNLGPAGASPAYLLDTKLPTVPVVTAPASPSSNSAPVFTFTTDGDTTTTCRVMRGSVVAVDTVACAGGTFTAPLAGQPDGDYVVMVTAVDPATNTSTGSSSVYTYDTTKPLAPVVTGPAGPAQNRNPGFNWTGEAGARSECSLQEKTGTPGAWVACATPYAPTLPRDGSWVLSVRLVDAAGNISDPGSSGAYVLDTTAPTTPVVTAPTSPGRDLSPSWSASTEEGSRTECRLSGPGQPATWVPCTLPMATPITADGTYTLDVRATDVAGNVSAPGTGTYVLDTTAPPAPLVVQPASPGRIRNPSVTFTAEPGTTGSCRLTHGATVLSDSAPCASPATLNLTGLNDGTYTLSIRAVDLAGNIGPAGTATYVLDTTAPAAPTMTLVAGSPSSDRAPVFGFNAELGTTPSCKVTLPSGSVRDLTCLSPLSLDLSGAADGDYDVTIRTTDAAGNVSAAATTTYSLDSTVPAAPKVVGPATPGSIRNPVWRISSTKPAECRVLRGTTVFKDWTPCGTSYALDLFAQPDAVYALEARVIGATGATSSRYRLDTTGPAAATIVGPPSPSTDRKPTWGVASADTTVRAECRVMVFTGVLKDWAPCGVSPAGSLYTLDLTGLGDGTYSLVVRLTDAANNVGPTVSSDYVLDTSAPAAVGVIAPLSPGKDTTPTWTLTSGAGVKLECRLSSGQKVISDFAPCTGTFTADLTGLPDGTYTLTVHALSAAGTPGPETTSGYILDTTAAGAPGTLTGPTGPSRNRTPTWTFSLAPGTTAVCKVTFGGKVIQDGPCVSPFVLDLSNAPDGTYTLTVRAVDPAGNLGDPSTAGYILKTTPPPAPTMTMQPGSPSSTTAPTWGFSLFRGTSAQCRLLQGGQALEDWTACGTSGSSNGTVTALLSGKPDGRYTMQIRAIDAALNTSSAIAGDYVFDRSAAPLALFVDTPPTPGNDTTPSWVVSAPPADTTPTTTTAGTAALLRTAALTGTPQTECRLTGPRGTGTWAPCSGRYVASTNGDGSYVLEVRAFDAAGERGPASSSTYVLDTRAPAAPRFIDPVPPAVGNDAEVVWSWADDENLVQCHLLRNGSSLGGFTACDPPYVANVGRQGEATYMIEARAVDPAGNVSPVTTGSYRYDNTAPPAPTFTSRPPARGSSGMVTWTFGVPVDTRAVCIVTRSGTVISEGACNGAFTLDLHGQQPATWGLSVHLVDAAGNEGPAAVGTYTLLSSVGRGRVDGPVVPGIPGSPGTPDASGAPGSPTGGGVTPSKPVPGIDKEQPRAGAATRIPQLVKKGIKKVARLTAGIPGAVPGTDVPKAIKNVLGQTITKPQLPLALFVIVLLFLLVQNRIDRRDPKLAIAPSTAEPELTFGPILRPGGASA
ncbi:MAG: large repetitive protein [Actinomycetota bacterium]|jgi:hypothetical protein|nr:large repetitive protein [Actinomycetota bacterium]